MSDFLSGTVTSKDWAAVAGVLGIAVLLAAGFYFFVHRLQIEKRDQILANDNLVYEDLSKAKQCKATIEDLRSETENIGRLVTEFEERLPSRREIPTLLKEFEAMADDEDIDVELSAMQRDQDATKETIPYKIVAHGSYHQIASFNNRLDSFKRYLKISNLKIGASENGVSTASFTLNTYRFLQT